MRDFCSHNLAKGYKVLQRIYKFGGQPYFNDFLTNNYKSSFQNAFGERNGKSMMSATAGRCVKARICLVCFSHLCAV